MRKEGSKEEKKKKHKALKFTPASAADKTCWRTQRLQATKVRPLFLTGQTIPSLKMKLDVQPSHSTFKNKIKAMLFSSNLSSAPKERSFLIKMKR